MIAAILARVGWLASAGVLAGMVGALHPALDLASHFRPHLSACALLLGLVAVRSRPLWLPLVPTVVGGAGLAQALWVLVAVPVTPGITSQMATGPDSLSILSANVLAVSHDREPLIAFLKAQDVDVLALMEVTPAVSARVTEVLGERYPWRADCTRVRRCGVLLLSRRPFLDAPEVPSQPDPDRAVPAHVKARVALGDTAVTLVAIHLTRPYPLPQPRQITTLGALVGDWGEPMVIAGDFNMTPWSHAFRSLVAVTGLRRAGWSFGTYPAKAGPFGLPIDHILTTPGLSATPIKVLDVPGADHRGLMITVTTRAGT